MGKKRWGGPPLVCPEGRITDGWPRVLEKKDIVVTVSKPNSRWVSEHFTGGERGKGEVVQTHIK